MIFACFVAGGGLYEVVHSTRDHRLVPARAVLLLEAQNVSLGIQSRRQARAVQHPPRQQRVALSRINAGSACTRGRSPAGCSAKSVARRIASWQSSARIKCSPPEALYASLKSTQRL